MISFIKHFLYIRAYYVNFGDLGNYGNQFGSIWNVSVLDANNRSNSILSDIFLA